MRKVFEYLLGIIGAIIITPFAVLYYGVLLFWKIFSSTVIGYIILGLLGCTYEESLQYGAGMGFLVGVYLKYRELKK